MSALAANVARHSHLKFDPRDNAAKRLAERVETAERGALTRTRNPIIAFSNDQRARGEFQSLIRHAARRSDLAQTGLQQCVPYDARQGEAEEQ